MSDYKPTTDDMRHEYAVSFRAEYQQEARQEFDRMIEAVRAEEREKAAQIAERWRRRCAEETLAWVEATKRADEERERGAEAENERVSLILHAHGVSDDLLWAIREQGKEQGS